jgi:hypothetical protein
MRIFPDEFIKAEMQAIIQILDVFDKQIVGRFLAFTI